MSVAVTWMTKQTIREAARLLGVPIRTDDATAYLAYQGLRAVMVRVAVDGRRVVGAIRYVIEGGADYYEITNVAVAADRRREGIGRAMLASVRAELDDRRPTLWIPVPEDNLPALAWLRAIGGWEPPTLGHGGEGEPDIVWFKHSIKARKEVAA